MKKIYLLCNAHIDPVWLWQWKEGAAETLSTFRIAADFCEKYDGFVFNHNEALLYEWIETFDPQLFERIQGLVAQGKWHIMGGWYLQPDCMIPEGESIFRQIETGREYFREKFGSEPKVAVNMDSFGHSRGLVQILKQSGYEGYLFMRSGNSEQGDYLWKGYDGSEVAAHQLYGGYGTLKGKTGEKIENFIREYPDREESLILWGIGNHGGGPSEEDLQQVEQLRGELSRDGWNIVHGTPEEYFASERVERKSWEKPYCHCMIGCYTSAHRIKQLHRQLENTLYRAEKMLAHAAAANLLPYPEKELKELQKTMLFCEFHDILPGTLCASAMQEEAAHLGGAIYRADQMMMKAFFALTRGCPRGDHWHIPVFAYNPYPYPVKTPLELEFMLENQNWNEDEETRADVCDEAGHLLPSQYEKTECTIPLDWRKRVVFEAELAPYTMNVFECRLHVEKKKERKPAAYPVQYVFDNGERSVTISTRTGLIESLKVYSRKQSDAGAKTSAAGTDYVEYAPAPLGILSVRKDNEDPWGMDVKGFPVRDGEFRLLSREEASEFRGFGQDLQENVQIIEDGEVRTVVQAIFGYRESRAVVEYIIPRNGVAVEYRLRLLMNNVHRMVKLEIPFASDVRSEKRNEYLAEAMYGIEALSDDGNEQLMQKWCLARGGEHSLGILNDGIHGLSVTADRLELSLVRTAAYSAHPIFSRQILPHDRFVPHIDLGENTYHFCLLPEAKPEELPALAQQWNQKPVVVSFYSAVPGERPAPLMRSDASSILYSSARVLDGKLLVRCINESETPVHAHLEFPVVGYETEVEFGPFEIRMVEVDLK